MATQRTPANGPAVARKAREQFVATVTGGGLAALLVMAWIECYIRERMLNRRLQAPPPAPREAAPGEFKSAKELPL